MGTTTLTLVYSPLPPQKIAADTGDGKVTLIWDNVFGALSYNVYWSAVPGVSKSTGSLISNATSPYTLNGLTNGVTYYFVLTTVSSAGESAASTQLSATAGAPPRPTGVDAQASGGNISVSWNPVPGATSFNLYWSNQPGVTKATGTKIAGATIPFLHTGLSGIPYYYVVTAQNGIGESLESLEMTAAPQLPPPPPGKITVIQESVFDLPVKAVQIAWAPVPGVTSYTLSRCDAWSFATTPPTPSSCRTYPANIYVGSEASYLDWGVEVGRSYRYQVTAINAFGGSAPSPDAGIYVAQ
ncbi:MAG: fibronectin type III domain-containing protein [Burkholderiales bacterium]